MSRRLPFALVWVLAACTAETVAPASPLATRVALIRAVHPAPERTLSAEALDARVSAETSEGVWAETRALRRVVAALGDSHLAVGLPAPADGEPTFVPFLVKRVGERYLVDAANGITIGEEITAIEGEPVGEVMARLAELSTVDGARTDVQLAGAERRFAEHMRLELGPKESWRLTTRPLDGLEERQHQLAGVPIGRVRELERSRLSGAVRGREAGELPELTEHDSVTILRLATFAVRDRDRYLAEVAALAPRMASAERLVVDLRGNEGGFRDLGVAVASHLLARPFTQWRSVAIRAREIPEVFADHVSFVFGSETDLREFPGDRSDDGWRYDGEPLADLMQPAEPRYDGPLTIFVDDATNSAAIELAVALLAHHPDVTVVGTETQGECGWHVGELPILFDDGMGPPLLMSLFEIELVRYDGCRPRRGIEPDVPIDYSLEDFQSGEDPYLRAIGVL